MVLHGCLKVYNYDVKHLRAPRYTGPPGGPCGSLALLIGMAAFSAEEHLAEEVVSKCFTAGRWKPHNRPTGLGRKSKILFQYLIRPPLFVPPNFYVSKEI
jgi:hypothetical protein